MYTHCMTNTHIHTKYAYTRLTTLFVTPGYPSPVDSYPSGGRGNGGLLSSTPYHLSKTDLFETLPIFAVCLNMCRNYQSCTIPGRNLYWNQG